MAGYRVPRPIWTRLRLLLAAICLLVPIGSLGQEAAEGPELAFAILQEARGLAARGEVEAALEKTERALAFARAEAGPFDALVGFILDDLATLNYRLGRLDEALAHAEQALTVIGAARGTASTGYALVASNLASILSALDRAEDALPLYRDALEVLERTLGRGHARTAATARNLATVQEALGRHAEAAASYALAIEGFRRLDPDQRTAARLMVERAEVLLRLGRVDEAERDVRAARARLEAIRPEPAGDLARADLALADLDLLALQPLEAEDRLLRAARRLADAGDEAGGEALLVQSRLASLDQLMGRPAQARRRLVEVLAAERARLGPAAGALAVLHRRLGEARLDEGELEAAEAEFAEALRRAKDAGERSRAGALLALAALRAGRVDEAAERLGERPDEASLALLERAAPADLARLAEVLPPVRQQRLVGHLEAVAAGPGSACRAARALTALGLLRQGEGAYPAAERALDQATRRIDGTLCPDDSALEAALALADFRLADGLADDAVGLVAAALEGTLAGASSRRLLERALDLIATARGGMPDPAALDLMLEVAQRIWSAEQRAVDEAVVGVAIEGGRAAADRLRSWRRLKASLHARMTLIHGSDPPIAGPRPGDQARSAAGEALEEDADRLERLERELARAEPELARLLSLALGRAEVQPAIRPDESILLQVTGGSTSHLFLLRQQSARYAQTSMGRAELDTWVDEALGQIAAREGPFDSFALHALYVGLVSPFVDELEQSAHLIVLLDGAARRLPLGALVADPAEPVDVGDGFASLTFLGERVAVSMIQDLAPLLLRPPPSEADIAFAGFAAPGSRDVPAPDPTRAARLQAIAASLTAEKALLDLQAARSGIMALDLASYRTLAFAMPVVVDGDGLPALAVAGDPADGARMLRVQDVARLELDALLVLLIDDATGLSAERALPAALLPAFALAGARALLTTFWAVGPDPVSRIMGPAVQAMLDDPGLPPAEALQAAIRPLIAGAAGVAASHPAFWAPFGVSLASR